MLRLLCEPHSEGWGIRQAANARENVMPDSKTKRARIWWALNEYPSILPLPRCVLR
jgi:hypothetical protein